MALAPRVLQGRGAVERGMSVAPRQRMSAHDFLVWEASAPTRHEFVAGEVFAMAGASRDHVTVCFNLIHALRAALKGKSCQPFGMDMKLRVEATDSYFYPDLFVTCSPADLAASEVMSEPTVVIEVLSASTAAYDRGDKFRAYRQLPSFHEYVLIDPEAQRIEIFRRDGASALWTLDDMNVGSALELKSLEITIAWADVFENVALASHDLP